MPKTLQQEAVEACRQWARIRDTVIIAVDNDTADAEPDDVREFDKQMFALGAVAYPAYGELLSSRTVDS